MPTRLCDAPINEIHDLTEMVGFVVKHRATKEDVREIAREEIGMR